MQGDPKYAVPYAQRAQLLCSALADVAPSSDSKSARAISTALVKCLKAGARDASAEVTDLLKTLVWEAGPDDTKAAKTIKTDVVTALGSVENMLKRNTP